MAGKEPIAQPDILSGWKDIAKYMGKGVRTVQRYERDLGLPVRRLPGRLTGPVIATKSDVDSWVGSSATQQESFNKTQKSLNVEQQSFNEKTRSNEDRLVSDVARGLQDRAKLEAEITEMRKELRMGLRNLRECLLKVRQQLDKVSQLQDFVASAIKHDSKVRALRSATAKRSKPN